MKKRLDSLVVERGITSSRERAKAYIIGGNITVNGDTVIRPAAMVREDSKLELALLNDGYVSRGGVKLEGALKDFNIDVKGANCLDIGSSTGGFTDCLLRYGAGHVTALDVGKNLIDYRLRNDPRVTVVEKFNARHIDQLYAGSVSPQRRINIVTIDVSFISLKLILQPLLTIIDDAVKVVALIKPQFEIEQPYRGFKGVVRDPEVHISVLNGLNDFFFTSGYEVVGYSVSKLVGQKGNIEFFTYLEKTSPGGAASRKHSAGSIEKLVRDLRGGLLGELKERKKGILR
jgi:23S rRNA (cytidine1920-2'-O)/16S rRNA (cytidine1409-2'-O)-methyltransferase